MGRQPANRWIGLGKNAMPDTLLVPAEQVGTVYGITALIGGIGSILFMPIRRISFGRESFTYFTVRFDRASSPRCVHTDHDYSGRTYRESTFRSLVRDPLRNRCELFY